MTKRESAIMTAFTGIVCGDFVDAHEYIEEIMGRPVLTHELASKEFAAEIKEAARADFEAMVQEVGKQDQRIAELEAEVRRVEGHRLQLQQVIEAKQRGLDSYEADLHAAEAKLALISKAVPAGECSCGYQDHEGGFCGTCDGLAPEITHILADTREPIRIEEGYYLPEQGFGLEPIDGCKPAVRIVMLKREGES